MLGQHIVIFSIFSVLANKAPTTSSGVRTTRKGPWAVVAGRVVLQSWSVGTAGRGVVVTVVTLSTQDNPSNS